MPNRKVFWRRFLIFLLQQKIKLNRWKEMKVF